MNIATEHPPSNYEEERPVTYRVLTDGSGRFKAGLVLGHVVHRPSGWYFLPTFQSQPSRRGWETPEAALKGRVPGYTLEPVK